MVPIFGLIVGVLTLCVAAFGVFLTWYLPTSKRLRDQEPWVEFSVGSFSSGNSQGLNVRLVNKHGGMGRNFELTLPGMTEPRRLTDRLQPGTKSESLQVVLDPEVDPEIRTGC